MHVMKQGLSVIFMACVACGWPSHHRQASKPASGDLQNVLARYNQLDEEMTEQEVDRILTGFPSYRRDEERKETCNLKRLSKPSAFNRRYSNKKDATEHDYFIDVYFDKSGRVVGKDYGEWER